MRRAQKASPPGPAEKEVTDVITIMDDTEPGSTIKAGFEVAVPGE